MCLTKAQTVAELFERTRECLEQFDDTEADTFVGALAKVTLVVRRSQPKYEASL